jgi:hypothetical protein
MSIIVGTQVEDAIVPKDTADRYPTHYSRFGRGGFHSDVADLTARDAIPAERRERGMRVYVLDVAGVEKEYQLRDGLLNTNWVEITGGGDPYATEAEAIAGLLANRQMNPLNSHQAIESLAVVNRYRRGYNGTGVSIPAFTFVTLDTGFFSNYPKIKPINSYSGPSFGVTTAALADSSGAKLIHYGIVQFPISMLDTTAVPLGTKVYINSSGQLTLNYTPIFGGFTMSQSTSPHILLCIRFFNERYNEFSFTNLLTQNFVHDFSRYSNFIVLDALGNDISSSVLIEHATNKLSITVTSNIPVTGTLICSC